MAGISMSSARGTEMGVRKDLLSDRRSATDGMLRGSGAPPGPPLLSTHPNRHLDHVFEPLTNRDDDLASGVSGLDISDRRSGLGQRVGSIDD